MTKKLDEALLATLFEHVGDAIEVTDTDLRIAYVNPAFERITGYDKAEVIGRTPAIGDVAIKRDITDRGRAEEALRDSERRFKA